MTDHGLLLKLWINHCEGCKDLTKFPRERQADIAIMHASRLVGLAHAIAGVACPKCSGEGRRVYGSTATWQGGIGGQAMTEGICDKCWGTGRTDRIGVDLRKLKNIAKEP